MTIEVILHEAAEGGYWASVPSLPGCVSEGEGRDETLANIREAIECYLDCEASNETPDLVLRLIERKV